MKFDSAILLLASCALASAVRFSTSDEEWREFKAAHGKTYRSKAEEAIRRRVFEDNLALIQRHNFEADLGIHSFRLGVNEYTDLTDQEFKKFLLGARPPKEKEDGATFLAPSNVQLPDTVDWRQEGYVTPVKNQGQCGSCWAFSSTGALEGQHFRKTGRLVSLSEQNLVDCTRNAKYRNDGCDGGWMSEAFRYVRDNDGIDTEVSYPYEARDGPCRYKRSGAGATDTGFVKLPRANETALKVACATIGPISVAIDAGHPGFMNYKSGVYFEPLCSNIRINHAVLVVGYGTENGQDYWLVKNSWGKSWGLQGYIKMARNRDNMCAIASYGVYPTV